MEIIRKPHNFKPFLNPIFIETGSATGEGIKGALAAGFKKIHSIELSSHYFSVCEDAFEFEKRVKLYHGDSRAILPKILTHINERCTFWLDAHYCGYPTAGEGNAIPLMDELKIIANHHIKDHTILIDDVRLIGNENEPEWKKAGFGLQEVTDFIYKINPNYTICFVDGYVENDILVAKVYGEV